MFIYRYGTYLEVWKLGSYAVDESGNAIHATNAVVTDDDVGKKNKKANQKDIEVKIEQDTIDGIYRNVIPKKQRTKISLDITEKPTRLLKIHTKHKRQIRCCELSPTGEFIIYATEGHLRMLKMELESEEDEDVSLICNIIFNWLLLCTIMTSYGKTVESPTSYLHYISL